MRWVNILNPKDWFDSKEQFEFVLEATKILNAQEVVGYDTSREIEQQVETKKKKFKNVRKKTLFRTVL